jgi:hypothetical protein
LAGNRRDVFTKFYISPAANYLSMRTFNLHINYKIMPNNKERLVSFYPNQTDENGKGLPRHSFKIGRNEKCYCGSGLKHKNCCGKAKAVVPTPVVSEVLPEQEVIAQNPEIVSDGVETSVVNETVVENLEVETIV